MSNLNRVFKALRTHHNAPWRVADRGGKRLTRRQLKKLALVVARDYPGFHSPVPPHYGVSDGGGEK